MSGDGGGGGAPLQGTTYGGDGSGAECFSQTPRGEHAGPGHTPKDEVHPGPRQNEGQGRAVASSPRKTPPATPEVCERTARAGRKPTVGRPAGSRTGSEGTGSCDRDRHGQGGRSRPTGGGRPTLPGCAAPGAERRTARRGSGAGPERPGAEACPSCPRSLAAKRARWFHHSPLAT